jgi:hypothetical protein
MRHCQRRYGVRLYSLRYDITSNNVLSRDSGILYLALTLDLRAGWTTDWVQSFQAWL